MGEIKIDENDYNGNDTPAKAGQPDAMIKKFITGHIEIIVRKAFKDIDKIK